MFWHFRHLWENKFFLSLSVVRSPFAREFIVSLALFLFYLMQSSSLNMGEEGREWLWKRLETESEIKITAEIKSGEEIKNRWKNIFLLDFSLLLCRFSPVKQTAASRCRNSKERHTFYTSSWDGRAIRKLSRPKFNTQRRASAGEQFMINGERNWRAERKRERSCTWPIWIIKKVRRAVKSSVNQADSIWEQLKQFARSSRGVGGSPFDNHHCLESGVGSRPFVMLSPPHFGHLKDCCVPWDFLRARSLTVFLFFCCGNFYCCFMSRVLNGRLAFEYFMDDSFLFARVFF